MNKLILEVLSFELERYHNVRGIAWYVFLAPFINSFLDYYKNNPNKTKMKTSDNFEIPYGNNDFIISLEKETYYYKILTNKLNFNFKKISIAKPNNQYIDKYIFPYSYQNHIAYLDFFNNNSKILYYSSAIFRVKRCKLDYFQDLDVAVDFELRELLLKKLIAILGEEHKNFLNLLVYIIPSIYIENFSFYYKHALKESKKLKDIKVIFFIRHVFFNPTFLILLSLNSIRKKQLITFQHGGVYGQTEPNWSEVTEKTIATSFLTWGYKIDPIDIPFVSLRFKKNFYSIILKHSKEKNILVVLPLLFRDEQKQSISNSLEILSKTVWKQKTLYIRFDPREKNQSIFYTLFGNLGLQYKEDTNSSKLPSVAKGYQTQIFITPNATGYLELINEGLYPLMVFHEKDWNIRKESLSLYHEMKKNNIWIDFDNANNISLNKIEKKQKNVIKKFRDRFVRTSFFPEFKLIYFLLKEARRKD